MEKIFFCMEYCFEVRREAFKKGLVRRRQKKIYFAAL
jgi:hypothetical protein